MCKSFSGKKGYEIETLWWRNSEKLCIYSSLSKFVYRQCKGNKVWFALPDRPCYWYQMRKCTKRFLAWKISKRFSVSLAFIFMKWKWQNLCPIIVVFYDRITVHVYDFFLLISQNKDINQLAFWMYFIIFFLAFSYSNVTHKIYFGWHIIHAKKKKEKQSFEEGGGENAFVFYTW